MIFMLNPNIEDIKAQAEMAHNNGKKFFIHIDLAEGIGKDEYGIRFVKNVGVDGIISRRTNIIGGFKTWCSYSAEVFHCRFSLCEHHC